MADAKQFCEQFKQSMAKMKEQTPDMLSGFGGLFQRVMKQGALSVKEKECVALGIAVAMRCEQCIHLHVQKCLDAGLTRAQVLEAASVAVMMQGGPAYTHIPVVMDALNSFGV
jgi:AhpD family alkylhydroperoxidase